MAFAITIMLPVCAPDTPAPQRTESSITWGGTIDMEESDSTLLALPVATRDGDGFLVADHMEAQIRRYDGDGGLDWSAGRKGDGPGEFHNPTSVARLPNGEVLATDFRSRLVRYTADGTRVLATTTLPLSRVERVMPLSDERVILAGMEKTEHSCTSGICRRTQWSGASSAGWTTS
ncbi:MAG TPA: hypothetical protein VF035_05485 [Longimicrobiales bacterium]